MEIRLSMWKLHSHQSTGGFVQSFLLGPQAGKNMNSDRASGGIDFEDNALDCGQQDLLIRLIPNNVDVICAGFNNFGYLAEFLSLVANDVQAQDLPVEKDIFRKRRQIFNTDEDILIAENFSGIAIAAAFDEKDNALLAESNALQLCWLMSGSKVEH